MLRKWIILLTLALLATVAYAQTATTRVVAVLFYTPTCPYCRIVKENHLPRIQAQFGDQLEILLVNVQQQAGAMIYHQACAALDAGGRCGGVPLLAVSDQLLMGAHEIPDRLPAIVEQLLAQGGVSLPTFPEMSAIYDRWLRSAGRSTAISSFAVQSSVWDRLAADPEGNAAAVLVLIGLVASLIAVIGWGRRGQPLPRWSQVIVGLAVVCVLLAGSLALAALQGSLFAAVSAWGALGLAVAAVGVLARPNLRERLGVPLVALMGLSVAVYLLTVETGSTEATCGLIGNCSAVQHSAYARVLGVPVGLIGVIGYAGLLALWGWAQRSAGMRRQQLEAALLALTLGGVAFSAYLTFLEPFVIGATCAWCLLSAVSMALLLWLIAPRGWQAYHALMAPAAAPRRRPRRA